MDHLIAPLAGRHAGLPLDVLALLSLLSLAPFIVVMTTSFVRIVVVLSLVRSAIGAASLPPNAVLTGLALVLSFTVMGPTVRAVAAEAVEPYQRGAITQAQMFQRGFVPVRRFMLRQTHAKDLALFARLAGSHEREPARLPPEIVAPAFVVGELRDAFAIGVALYLPFVAIDLAVSAILMGLGMFMLSPPIISLPCKLLLFVMVDGWSLVCGGLVQSFR
ncbi:MAG: flagellar type III secretion system pore protein FliP [Vulcanimicrobiaceae bacterium]